LPHCVGVNMNAMSKMSQFSPVVFALLGLICGLIISKSYVLGFTCLGACLGALVGIIASVMCLVVDRKNCVSTAALVCNLILFVVIAKELQLFG